MRTHSDLAGPYRVFGDQFPSDGLVVRKWTDVGSGIEYPDPDEDGVMVTVPWGKVDRVVAGLTSDDREQLERQAEADEDPRTLEGVVLPPGNDNARSITAPGAPAPGDTPPVDPDAKSEPDTGKVDDTGKAETAEKGKGDPKAGKAKEWADADPAEVRAWAKENNVEVAQSGTISKSVLAQYAAAKSS